MDLLKIYNTPENHEAAKKLLKKFADPAYEYEDGFYDFFANALMYELCDSLSSGLDKHEIASRVNDYYDNPSDDGLMAVISGLRHARLAYIAGPDGKIKTYPTNILQDDGSVEVMDAVTLFYEKSKHNRWMEDGDSMHLTGFNSILKMCDKAGLDLFLIDPSPEAIVFGHEEIESCSLQLDAAGEVVRRTRFYGFSRDELFTPLLLSFDGRPVRCAQGEGIMEGMAYISAECDNRITIMNFRPAVTFTMPVDSIKSIQEIKVTYAVSKEKGTGTD